MALNELRQKNSNLAIDYVNGESSGCGNHVVICIGESHSVCYL